MNKYRLEYFQRAKKNFESLDDCQECLEFDDCSDSIEVACFTNTFEITNCKNFKSTGHWVMRVFDTKEKLIDFINKIEKSNLD